MVISNVVVKTMFLTFVILVGEMIREGSDDGDDSDEGGEGKDGLDQLHDVDLGMT